MKVLIISFDKALTDKLKEALSNHEVFTAKNSEEALTLIPRDIDVIIFDAISGAISEEEINQLYEKKFSTQRYIVLYDELFPVDENNIQPPNKVLIVRDNALEEVLKILEESQTAIPSGESKEKEEVSKEEEKERPTIAGRHKILIVSFDKKLTDELESLLKDKYDTEVVKNQKLVKEKGKTASVIVFDAISGTIAEKNLSELAEDPNLREKPFLILMDDLFPINVEKLSLPNKEVVNRDAPATLIVEHIENMVQGAERPSETITEKAPEEEETKLPVEEIPEEELIRGNVLEVEEEQKTEKEEEKQESLEERIEVQATKSEPPQPTETALPVNRVDIPLDEKTLKAAIVEAVAKELAGLREEVKAEVSGYIRDVIESVVREEVERYLLELKIGDIIREETKKIVEEKLKELLS